MLSLPKSTTNGNGHAGTVNGRGLARRRLTPEQWIDLAADLACGQYKFEPSLLQISRLFGVPVHHLRDELKRRSAAQDAAATDRWLQQSEAEQVNAEADAIVTAWDLASPAGRDAAIRTLSPSTVWDAIAPVVA
jgi:hypothetical protein